MLHVVLRPGAGSWSAPVGFGVGGGVGGGAQPNPCNLLYNPYVPEPVPAPVPAIAAPPARNVQVAREGRPRRGPNPNPNAGPGPANQRGRIGAPTVAASAPRATRGARGAEANPPPAANAFAFRIDPLAPPPPPPMFGPSRRAVRAAERAADRHAQMEEARAATERMRAEQRARIEAVVARHRQEMAARVAARLEREEMAGGDEGAGGGGAGPAR